MKISRLREGDSFLFSSACHESLAGEKKKSCIFIKVSFFPPWNFQPAVYRPDSKLLFLFVIPFKKKYIPPQNHTYPTCWGLLFFLILSFPSVCVVFIITHRQLLNINNNNNKTLAGAASKDPCARCSMNFLATNNSSWLLFLEPHPPGVGVWKWSAPHRSRGLRQLHEASPSGGSSGTGRSGRHWLVLFLFLSEATSPKSKYLLPFLDTHTKINKTIRGARFWFPIILPSWS